MGFFCVCISREKCSLWESELAGSPLCPGFPGGRGEAGHPSAVRRRGHGGAADPGQAEHPHLRVAVLQLLQRATSQ